MASWLHRVQQGNVLQFQMDLRQAESWLFLRAPSSPELRLSWHDRLVEANRCIAKFHRHFVRMMLDKYCQSHAPIGADDVQSSNGFSRFWINFLIRIQHSKLNSQLSSGVSNYGIRKITTNILTIVVNVINPFDMRVQRVNGMSQNFDVSLSKLVLMDSNAAQLGAADRCKVGRVREQKAPSKKIRFNVFHLQESYQLTNRPASRRTKSTLWSFQLWNQAQPD